MRSGGDPRLPTVAVETAFLTTGLPAEVGLEVAARMGEAVEGKGARAAFVGVVEGRPVVGLDRPHLERLAGSGRKLSTRDLAAAAARGEDGGTTVSATVFLAARAGVEVVATGGIGGVHRGGIADVSADLPELARTPVVLVCSGPKAILDLPATTEVLETLGVAVVGWRTTEMPGFWTRESGIALERSVEDAGEVAAIRREAAALGLPGALVVCVPPPEAVALDGEASERAIALALEEAESRGIAGPPLTPFLLERIAEITEGRSLAANLALLVENAAVAAEIAVGLAAG